MGELLSSWSCDFSDEGWFPEESKVGAQRFPAESVLGYFLYASLIFSNLTLNGFSVFVTFASAFKIIYELE